MTQTQPDRIADATAVAPDTYFVAAQGEDEAVLTSCEAGLPVMLTGPTGCGKTRLIEHVAARLGRPLVTVACHDDLTSSDLVGRYLVVGGDVRWVDGPLTKAVRTGALCYLDEVAEARRDTLAVLHSLLDDRRRLYLDRTGEVVEAAEGFLVLGSYNPESRSVLKELKPSFRQRFVTIAVGYLPIQQEAAVLVHEAGVDHDLALRLARCALTLRAAAHAGIEPPSTRLLVATARLVAAGVDLSDAVQLGMVNPLAAEGPVAVALTELLEAEGVFGTVGAEPSGSGR